MRGGIWGESCQGPLLVAMSNYRHSSDCVRAIKRGGIEDEKFNTHFVGAVSDYFAWLRRRWPAPRGWSVGS